MCFSVFVRDFGEYLFFFLVYVVISVMLNVKYIIVLCSNVEEGRTLCSCGSNLLYEERWRSKPAGESGGDTVGAAASYECASACFDCLVLQAPCTVST